MQEKSSRAAVQQEFWVILAILGLALTGIPAVFTLSAETILFNPQPYQQALSAENAQAAFPQVVGDVMAQGGNVFLFGSGSKLVEVLKNSHYENILDQIFPQAWVQTQINDLVNQFWAYFNFQSSTFQLVVDLRPIKTRLNGPQGGQIAANIVQGFPPCQGKDLLNFGLQALQGQVNQLPLCRPPDQLVSAANFFVQESLKASAAAMPDQVDLASALKIPAALGGQPVSTAWQRSFALYHLYRTINPWLPWAALVFLVLVGLLSWNTNGGPLYWLGAGLLLVGIAAMLITLILALFSGQLLPLLAQQWFGVNTTVVNLMEGMLLRVFSQFLASVAMTAGGVTLLGLVLLGAWLWRRRRDSHYSAL